MEEATVGIRELKDRASWIIGRVEAGEAITVTRNGRPVARITSLNTPPYLAALIADGSVRAPSGPRYLPAKATKHKVGGKSATEYVSEGRR